MTPVFVFDRTLLRARRERAAAGYAAHRFLHDECGERLLDRLDDIRRVFPVSVVLGCGDGSLTARLSGRQGITSLLQVESGPALARQAAIHGPVVVADEEMLPIRPGSANLILSNLMLHWINDLPGALIQIRQALAPDGLFLASMLAGDTLFELRRCLTEAEMELTGGLSPRFSPLTSIREAGGLLQRAGFTLPTVDRDILTVTYDDPLRLLQDLRGVGATNATLNRSRRPLRRSVLLDAMRRYHDLFASNDGGVTATFEILTLTGWASHESQQQPLRPGTAKQRLADALGVTEKGAGEQAGPA